MDSTHPGTHINTKFIIEIEVKINEKKTTMYEFKMKINVKSIQSFACFVVFFKLMPARKSEIEIHPNRSINMDIEIGKIRGIKK